MSRPQVAGALTGKTVFLSPGHGFYHHDTLGWITQRGTHHRIVEDFLTSELACQYLLAYLENAGADVWTCRDRCLSTVEVIVDNAGPGYGETGAWSNTSSGGYRGSSRFAASATAETATATFTPDLPESGLFPLYLWFNSGANRSDAALVRVRHSGGEAEVRINQQRDGYTWRYAGTFYWLKGRGQSVVISNRSTAANSGRVVIADAIRIGGGMGSEPPNAGGPTSGRRRADECSVYWARYQGAPPSVYDPSAGGDGTDDVTCRPLYAEFESEPGEDSVYISIHSNGGGGRGTETYVYLDGSPPGSQALRDLVHQEVIRDLRAGWDAGWPDRGTKTANFGELRLLRTMPGILIEVAFHDQADDAASEREPHWRRIVARAIYHGIARYFRGDGATLLPEPPTALQARGAGSAALLSWRAPAGGAPAGGAGAPRAYRVYRSPNGMAFDGGVEVAGTTARIEPLKPGSLTFFRVTAVNAGGESLPTAVVAVRLPLSGDAPRALIVDGFDRLDGGLNLDVQESPALGRVDRQILDRRLNSFDYAVEHALALAAAPFDLAIDSCANEAVEAGAVALGDYDVVDWFTGRESVASDTLTPAERSRIQAYLAGGGALLISGQDLGLDLAASSSAAAREFFTTWLKADLAGDDAGTYEVRSSGPLSFTGQEAFFLAGGSRGIYDVDRPDVYLPLGGARAALVYGGTGGAAAVEFSGGYRLVHLGFPLEGIALWGARDLFVRRALDHLLGWDAPPRPVISVEPSPEVTLSGGRAAVTLDATLSDDGEGGRHGLACRWTKVSGPAGDLIRSPSGWEIGRASIGYGDGDDETVIGEMRGAHVSLYLVREFEAHAPAAFERMSLRAAFDDGFAAYLNGVEVARRNLPAGAGHTTPAMSAIEPEQEVIDITASRGLLVEGANLLAIQVHNASLDSSDLTIDVELALESSEHRERVIPSGAAWFFHRGRIAPPAGWNRPGFEATPRRTRIEFTRAGSYRYRLEVDDGRATAAAEVTLRVRDAAELFRRGDANQSGGVDLSDPVFILAWLFTGGETPACLDAADADDGGVIDISDAILLLQWLFLGGPEPAPPGPHRCGADPTEDGLAPCRVAFCEGAGGSLR
jgi:N-acetylmuramoyl-L-alanine amidase